MEPRNSARVSSPDSRPKIMFLEGSTGFGGSGSILISMLRHFDKTRFFVFAASYNLANPTFLKNLESCDVPYFAVTQERPFEPWAAKFVTNRRNRWVRKAALLLSWTYYFLFVQTSIILRLAALLRKKRISLVVLNNDLDLHSAGMIAAKLVGIPVIVRKAGGIDSGGALKKFLSRYADVFVVVSEATRIDQEKIPGTKRILLIPEAVDIEKFGSIPIRGQARKTLGLPEGTVIVGSASRLAEGKGHAELLRAAQQILRQRSDVLFYLAGAEDPADTQTHMLEKLQFMAKELGISDNVLLPGWQDTRNVLAAIDIFVHCPTTFIEGFCIANLEAMGSGRPTVVSRNGGLPDAVVNNVTGYIVEPGDIDALAKALLSLISHPEKVTQMGESARRRVVEKFDARIMTRALENVVSEYCKSA
jgi:glycosyltransferase involved in cell wall biosynthesis